MTGSLSYINKFSPPLATTPLMPQENQMAPVQNIENHDADVTAPLELKSALRTLCRKGAEFTKLLGGVSAIVLVATHGPAFLAPAVALCTAVWMVSNLVEKLLSPLSPQAEKKPNGIVEEIEVENSLEIKGNLQRKASIDSINSNASDLTLVDDDNGEENFKNACVLLDQLLLDGMHALETNKISATSEVIAAAAEEDKNQGQKVYSKSKSISSLYPLVKDKTGKELAWNYFKNNILSQKNEEELSAIQKIGQEGRKERQLSSPSPFNLSNSFV